MSESNNIYEDAELEEIRRRKLLEYQRRLIEAAEEERRRRIMEARKEAILRTILTPKARSRLTNLKIVKPNIAEQLELQLIKLAQEGRIPTPITDDMLKKILASLDRQYRREIRIRRL